MRLILLAELDFFLFLYYDCNGMLVVKVMDGKFLLKNVGLKANWLKFAHFS